MSMSKSRKREAPGRVLTCCLSPTPAPRSCLQVKEHAAITEIIDEIRMKASCSYRGIAAAV